VAITSVSFDFWNTLFTEAPDGFSYYADRRQSLLQQAVCEFRPVTAEEIITACRAEARLHHSIWISEHRTLRAEERISNCAGSLGVALPAAKLTDLAIAFEEGILERPPVLIEGARDVVVDLSHKYRLGIISDVGFSPGRVLRQVLRHAGVLDAFDSLVFSDEAGHSKPHREVFRLTSVALGASPAEIAHIGDLEHTDVIGAKQAGYRAIRFTGVTQMYSNESTIADAVTEDLRQLPNLLSAF